MNIKRITVLLSEDHRIVREGLRRILEMEADLEVIGEVQDGRQTVALAKKLRPDVVLMDIAMPLLNGLEATRQVLKAIPATKVLILSAHNDDVYIENAIESGAVGFLLKQTSSSHDVCQAIREIQKGKTFFSSSIARRLNLQSPDRTKLRNKKVAQLTSREVEVLQLIAEGKANKGIASELCISIKTVEKHRHTLRVKLKIRDTASLTRYAIAAGIIESSLPLTII